MEYASKNIAVGCRITNIHELLRLSNEGRSAVRLVRHSLFLRLQHVYEVKPAAFYIGWPLRKVLSSQFFYSVKINRMKIELKKLRDSYDPKHPNHIPDGHMVTGELINKPVVGEVFWVGDHWRTSIVQEVIDESTFRTMNSIYTFREVK